MAVIEASACGAPLIVSDVGGLPEVVVDGITGFGVAKRDAWATAEALVHLIEDPVPRRRMGEAGHQHVLNCYQWGKSAKLMEEVYEQLITAELDRVKYPRCGRGSAP